MRERAPIKESEISEFSVPLAFPFSSYVAPGLASKIVKSLISDQWPEVRRPKQCVYVIRTTGAIAVQYGELFSPVLYIGEGDVYNRLTQGHAPSWLAPLMLDVPQIQVEVKIFQIQRRKNQNLFRNIEADLLLWFSTEHGMLPWFNQQLEPAKHNQYKYDAAADRILRRSIQLGAGNRFRWAIQPTHNSATHAHYQKSGSAIAT